MKRKTITLMKIMATFALAVLMTSCGSKAPTPEEVNAKIEAGERLSQADYTAILEYVGEYANKAEGFYDTINVVNDSTEAYAKAVNELSALYAKYPYLSTFRECLQNADAATFDNKNIELVNKYKNDEGFPLPVGEGASMLNPDVQGMIEDMPNSDSGKVIATGVGEAVAE